MGALKTVLKEHLSNFYLIQRLSQFQLKISNHSNYLGLGWELINPLLQILVYWFVFGFGIRSNAPIDGVPFIYWLLVGISMWFFMNQGILEGTKAVSMKYNQVAKMNFPLSILPTYIVTSRIYGHVVLLAIIIGVCALVGIYPTIHIIQVVIFVAFAYLFTVAISLFTSTLGVIIRDTQMAIQAFLRIVFYASGILFVPAHGSVVEKIIMLNPVYFFAEGYRSAILYHNWYIIDHWQLALYNLAIIVLFFFVGAVLHMRYRDQFADFM